MTDKYIEHENEKIVYYRIESCTCQHVPLLIDAFEQLSNNNEGVYAFLVRYLLLDVGNILFGKIYNIFEQRIKRFVWETPRSFFTRQIVKFPKTREKVTKAFDDTFQKRDITQWSDVRNLWILLRCYSSSLTRHSDNEVDLQGLIEIIRNCDCFSNESRNCATELRDIRNLHYAHISAATGGCSKKYLEETQGVYTRLFFQLEQQSFPGYD